MKPKKSFGQNFLTSIPARNEIVKAGDLKLGDMVLEIGPGKGILTEKMLADGATVYAIEKDRDLIPILSEKFAEEIKNKKLILINDDILNFQPSTFNFPLSAYKLIANIPYNITGAIIEKFLSEENKPDMMVVLVQKEVAERVVARDKKESILSLSVKVYGEPKIIYKVNKGSFFPIPKVDSAVLKISNISNKNFKNKTKEENFFKVVKAGFSHKRKFLISNLKEKLPEINWQEVFIKNKLNEKVRAEDLNLENWMRISSNF